MKLRFTSFVLDMPFLTRQNCHDKMCIRLLTQQAFVTHVSTLFTYYDLPLLKAQYLLSRYLKILFFHQQ